MLDLKENMCISKDPGRRVMADFVVKVPLLAAANSDSVSLTRTALEIDDDGAAQAGSRAAPGQFCTGFVMNDPALALATDPISTLQAPFEIGDNIQYSGTLLEGSAEWPERHGYS